MSVNNIFSSEKIKKLPLVLATINIVLNDVQGSLLLLLINRIFD